MFKCLKRCNNRFFHCWHSSGMVDRPAQCKNGVSYGFNETMSVHVCCQCGAREETAWSGAW